MTTLANLRAKLNGEVGVVTDADTAPWPVATRNNAISDGYAALFRAGVWKPVRQSITTVADQIAYTTTLRKLRDVWIIDSASGQPGDRIDAMIEPDGVGGYELILRIGLEAGLTLSVRGWTAYASTFANDAAVDDLPAEDNRVPLLKAKAILYRAQLASFARYQQREAAPADLQTTMEQLLGMIAACEREFEDEARKLAHERGRVGRSRDSRPV